MVGSPMIGAGFIVREPGGSAGRTGGSIDAVNRQGTGIEANWMDCS